MTALEKAAREPIKKLIPYLGYGEKNNKSDLYNMNTYGTGKYTLFAEYFDNLRRQGYNFYNGYKNGYDWCDMTVDWAICQAFGHDVGRRVLYQPMNSAGAGCSCSASYYRNNGAWISRSGQPLPGDQIFFGSYGNESHTGIVESVTASEVHTIEGNTSKKLLRRSYYRNNSRISGYGRPNYSLVAGNYSDGPEEEQQSEETQAAQEENQKIQEDMENLQKVLTDLSNSLAEFNSTNKNESSLVEDLNYGTTDWFEDFLQNYNNLLEEYNLCLNKINSLSFFYLRDNPYQILANLPKDYVIENLVTKPSQSKDSISYLWQKMFYGTYTPAQLTYLNSYPTDLKYEIACYYGYKDAIDFYTAEIKKWLNDFNTALIKEDIFSAWLSCFNILQANIYLLYIHTFGEITRELKSGLSEDEVNHSDIDYTYIRKGVSYNFGKNNEDYWIFINKAKEMTQLFKDNLYLPAEKVQTKFNYWVLNINGPQKVTDQHSIFEEAINSYSEKILEIQNNYMNDLTSLKEKSREHPILVDWRELIYQMARDYFDYYQNPNYDYQSMLLAANKDILKKNGTTGYEVFYTDLLGFWRELYYNPLLEKNDYDISNIFSGANSLTIDDFNTQTNWRKIVSERPSQLNYWFDLTEGYGELAKYTISAIGDRLKATKDSAVEALYYKDTPNIIYYEQNDIPKVENDGYNSYTYFQLGGPMLDVYTMSSQGKTAIDLLQDQLYKFAFCVENISITTLPIYTLKPNYRILIKSEIQGLSGEYIIDKFSIPFVYNGTMTINAIKAVPYIGING